MSEAQTITDRMESKRRSKPQQRCGGESYVSENEKKKQRTFKLRNVNFDHHETPSNHHSGSWSSIECCCNSVQGVVAGTLPPALRQTRFMV